MYALKSAESSGLCTLQRFHAAMTATAPGKKMMDSGIALCTDRAAIAAYLAKLK